MWRTTLGAAASAAALRCTTEDAWGYGLPKQVVLARSGPEASERLRHPASHPRHHHRSGRQAGQPPLSFARWVRERGKVAQKNFASPASQYDQPLSELRDPVVGRVEHPRRLPGLVSAPWKGLGLLLEERPVPSGSRLALLSHIASEINFAAVHTPGSRRLCNLRQADETRKAGILEESLQVVYTSVVRRTKSPVIDLVPVNGGTKNEA